MCLDPSDYTPGAVVDTESGLVCAAFPSFFTDPGTACVGNDVDFYQSIGFICCSASASSVCEDSVYDSQLCLDSSAFESESCANYTNYWRYSDVASACAVNSFASQAELGAWPCPASCSKGGAVVEPGVVD